MQPVSQNRLLHIVKSAGDTISYPALRDYLDYMEDAYVTFSIPNLASPLTEQMTTMKRYFVDNGILNLFMTYGDHILYHLICTFLIRKTDICKMFPPFK